MANTYEQDGTPEFPWILRRPRGLEEGIAVHDGVAGGAGMDEQALVVVVGRRVGLVVDRRRQDERENGGDCLWASYLSPTWLSRAPTHQFKA